MDLSAEVVAIVRQLGEIRHRRRYSSCAWKSLDKSHDCNKPTTASNYQSKYLQYRCYCYPIIAGRVNKKTTFMSAHR